MESVNCVIVTGSSGNGKSALIHHVALQMQKEQNYEIIPFVVGSTKKHTLLFYTLVE
jgi:ABC-type lipoprotein export system ATPase subunit